MYALDAREVDLVRLERADRYNLFRLDDGHFGRSSHCTREVLCGVPESRQRQHLVYESLLRSVRRAATHLKTQLPYSSAFQTLTSA